MSSFLKRGLNGEEPDQSADLEEQYKRLMPKIGRDFVTYQDLEDMMQRLMLLIDPTGSNPIFCDKNAAQSLAERYKVLVEQSKDGGESHRDLVKIDED